MEEMPKAKYGGGVLTFLTLLRHTSLQCFWVFTNLETLLTIPFMGSYGSFIISAQWIKSFVISD
jgi:hypothetical protein